MLLWWRDISRIVAAESLVRLLKSEYFIYISSELYASSFFVVILELIMQLIFLR